MEENEQVSTEKQNSVKYTTTSKGIVSCEVKAYAETCEEAFKESTRILELAMQVCEVKNSGKQ